MIKSIMYRKRLFRIHDASIMYKIDYDGYGSSPMAVEGARKLLLLILSDSLRSHPGASKSQAREAKREADGMA